jgi:transposase
MNNTRVGVDLAKDVIQVCIYTNNKMLSNTEMTPSEFSLWLINAKTATIIFEACGTSNYWKQVATAVGHDAKLICPKLVSSVRQKQKTDKNDAVAIVQASLLPDITFITGKTVEQQQLQSMMRMRELAIKQKTALSNQLGALLLEFNIRTSARNGGLRSAIESALENAENDFSLPFRLALKTAWEQYLVIIKSIAIYDESLVKAIASHPECQRLLKLEGVGTLNAINLYIALGCCELGVFSKGKDAAACIGVTPIQHSSGGKTKLGTIGKYVKNSILRSQLVVGAMSAVSQICKRTAKTQKERWVQDLVSRRGKRCAAVALVNKNIRTAYAMLTKGTEYQAQPIIA